MLSLFARTQTAENLLKYEWAHVGAPDEEVYEKNNKKDCSAQDHRIRKQEYGAGTCLHEHYQNIGVITRYWVRADSLLVW